MSGKHFKRPGSGRALRALTLALLIFGLCVTAYAISEASVTVSDSYFQTGSVKVELNGGEPVIREGELIFAPGTTVVKNFYIENRGTCDAYYKIYFDHVNGELADTLEVSIQDGDLTVFEGTIARLTRSNVNAADQALKAGEKKDLTISFHLPQNTQNAAQDQSLSFDLCAEAVQAKNNSDRRFN